MAQKDIVALVMVVLALGGGILFGRHFIPADKNILATLEQYNKGSEYSFVNPLLLCGEPSTVLPARIADTERAVEEYIVEAKQNGSVSDVAVYFRDLNNGPWFGIEEDMQFSPGSLLKVPVMMALLREAEQDPLLLSDRIIYQGGESNASQLVPTENPITPGQEYSVEELMRAMITRSDNNAALILYEFTGTEKVAKTYSDLGLASPTESADYQVEVRDYGSFFRLLYNATYLTPERSEYALALLADSTYTRGLVGGVPEGTKVAHKFGERGYGDGILQLHDCGIIYAPGKPYMLCVMTRGDSLQELEGTIAGISRIVYERIMN